MDAAQIRQLETEVHTSSSSGSTTASRARTPAPTCRCTSPGSSRTSPRRASSRSPSTPACRRGPCRSSSASTAGTTTGCATGSSRSSATSTPGPHSIGIFDETSDVKKGDKTPGVQRQWCGCRRQEGELHRHGPPGLRPRRLPLPARRRAVPAGVLVRRPRPLPRGRHPRRHGLPAQVEDRPGAVRPRRRPTACTSTG